MIKERLAAIPHVKAIILIAQFAILAAAVVLPVLIDFGYRPYDAETLILTSLAMLLSIPAALAAARWPPIRPLLFALGIYWFLDVYFIESGIVALFVVVAALVIAYTKFEPDLRSVGTIFAGIFMVINALPPYRPVISPDISNRAAASPSNQNLPLLIHIILDEQGSPFTTSSNLRATGRVDALVDAYAKRGFAVHPWVRASSDATQRSLGRVFDSPDANALRKNVANNESGDFTFSLERNRYIDVLQKRGFDVTVIQSSFIHLCVNQGASCYTYPRGHHGHSMSRFSSALADRLWLAAALVHAELYSTENVRHVALYRMAGDFLVRHGGMPAKRNYWTRPASVLEVLDLLERHATSMRRGEAYLVHLLAPHFPYVLDAACNLQPRHLWDEPPWLQIGNKPEGRLVSVEKAYWQQVECMHARLLEIIDNVEHAVGRDGVFVILHGDHGSRLISNYSSPTAGKLSREEPNVLLDTMLLIRGPGIEPTLNSGLEFLDELLWNISESHLAP